MTENKHPPSKAEVVVTAMPEKQVHTTHAIPQGYSRYFCEKCQAPYDLPQGASSWRCAHCMKFNSITPGECENCIVL